MNSEILNERDIKKITEHGISIDEIYSQIKKFKTGVPYSVLEKAAKVGDGIFDINKFDHTELLSHYNNSVTDGKLLKFVPASGAATRMFKDLIACYYSEDEISDSCNKTLSNLQNFPFYSDLKISLVNDGLYIDDLVKKNNYKLIFEYLLFEKGLNYSALPKALLKFSKNYGVNKTALEEHFVEGIQYVMDNDNNIHLHFTISEEHEIQARELSDTLAKKFLPENKFHITFSNQLRNTDTIAVDEKNDPFRDKDNNIVLRPGGHGALIHNLNNLDGDIVFIKNIDNVQRTGKDISIWKKLLAGLLIKLQNKVFNYVKQLRSGNLNNLSEIENFLINELNMILNEEYYDKIYSERTTHLLSVLIRPIRVCGMVKNTGAPGGGPFFVKKNNEISLQIVETSQIDQSNENQKKILESSTHFNPVDIVCGLKDNEGDSFNLLNYIDHDTYFISEKSVDGKPLKALELPGLWNGAMADWITVFVEVPLETFTPVKTVNDLL